MATAHRRSRHRAMTTTRKKNVKKRNARKEARIEKLEAEILKSENALKKYNDQLVIEANRNNLAQMNELSNENHCGKTGNREFVSRVCGLKISAWGMLSTQAGSLGRGDSSPW